MTAPLAKRCTRCNIEKPLADFHRDSTMADGRERRCKVCRAEMAAERYERHREKILARQKEYHAANTEAAAARNAAWWAAHPGSNALYVAAYKTRKAAAGGKP